MPLDLSIEPMNYDVPFRSHKTPLFGNDPDLGVTPVNSGHGIVRNSPFNANSARSKKSGDALKHQCQGIFD